MTLSGPTLFGPLVRAASQVAAAAGCSAERQQYTVLLVLTDGVINDMDSTKAALIEASVEPLSVVVVGLGEADCTDMHVTLSAPHSCCSTRARSPSEISCAFASYKEVAANGTAGCSAESVLAEVHVCYLVTIPTASCNDLWTPPRYCAVIELLYMGCEP